MNNLFVTVGLPRSGKSTWAKATGYPIVCPDAIRLALTGQAFVPTAEPMVWGLAQTMVRSLFLAGNTTVVLDATNVTAARRAMWAANELWTPEFWLFEDGVEDCLERLTDENQYLADVILRMAEEFEPVGMDEGVLCYFTED